MRQYFSFKPSNLASELGVVAFELGSVSLELDVVSLELGCIVLKLRGVFLESFDDLCSCASSRPLVCSFPI